MTDDNRGRPIRDDDGVGSTRSRRPLRTMLGGVALVIGIWLLTGALALVLLWLAQQLGWWPTSASALGVVDLAAQIPSGASLAARMP
jgi:hypothetical protein